GAIADARVGVGGAEARPRRIAEAEAALNGQRPEPDVFRAAGNAAAAAIDPLEDHNTSAEHRRDLVRAMTRRALQRAALPERLEARTRPAEMSTKSLSNAPKQDLRTWIAQMDAAGELQTVRGANREEEIGGIVDFYQRATNNKAVLFDDIPGYPAGYRAIAN